MNAQDTNSWSNFCDPHWELICRNKWQPRTLEISIPLEIAVGTHFHAWHGTKTGLTINGVWSHLHMPTHASFYLGVLLSHVQNFTWEVKKFTLQFPFCIEHQYLDNAFSKKIHKRYISVAFTCFCLPLFGWLQRKSVT